uniref:Uncharacterized protein LOC114327011 n=1 Tax=Diabrotica virgifera virgifera TaxID=50390 RepID=A0A6P7F965_DIAVI
MVSIDGYSFARQDRPAKASGVGMYIKNNYKFEIILSEYNELFEYIWITVYIGKVLYAIGTIYRKPKNNCSLFLEHCEDMFSSIFSNYDNIICVGDFNINVLDLEDNHTVKFYDIKEPTRGISLLDLIITNIDIKKCNEYVDIDMIADHAAVFCNLMSKVPNLVLKKG